VLFEERFVHVVGTSSTANPNPNPNATLTPDPGPNPNPDQVGITFTALIFTELFMVAVEVRRWHPLMLLAQVLTLLVYLGCIVALGAPQMIGLTSTFDIRFMLSAGFAWRVAAITAASTAPIWLGKLCAHYCAPQVVTKLA